MVDHAPARRTHTFGPRPRCSQCGTAVGTAAAFCAACGTRLAAEPPTAADRHARLVSRLRDRPLATVALVGCLAGLAALLLPLLEAAHGAFTLAPIDLPYIGSGLGALFAALTLFPVIDLVRGRLRWTPWLCLPATLGLIPVVAVLAAVTELPHLLHWIWAGTPDWAVEPGAGPLVFAAADVILLVAGLLAVAARVGGWRRLRTRRDSAQTSPAPVAEHDQELLDAAGPAQAELLDIDVADLSPAEAPLAALRGRIRRQARGAGGELGGRLAGLASAQNRERATRQVTRGSARMLAATATWSGRAHDRLRSRLASDETGSTPAVAAAPPPDPPAAIDTYTEPAVWPVVWPAVEPVTPDGPGPLQTATPPLPHPGSNGSTPAGRHRSP